jgi:hypothetical protein
MTAEQPTLTPKAQETRQRIFDTAVGKRMVIKRAEVMARLSDKWTRQTLPIFEAESLRQVEFPLYDEQS